MQKYVFVWENCEHLIQQLTSSSIELLELPLLKEAYFELLKSVGWFGELWQLVVGVHSPFGPLESLILKAAHFGPLVNTQLVLFCSSMLLHGSIE